MPSEKKLPWFPLFVADFVFGTKTLSNASVGIYLRLLCEQWDSGPINKKTAHMIARAKIPADVLAKFSERDGCLVNDRLERVRSEQLEEIRKKKERSIKGAEARWKHTPKRCSSNAEAMLEVCQSESESESESTDSSDEESVSCDEPKNGSPPEDYLLTFPCVKGRSGKTKWHLTESKLAEYVEAFPGVEVLAECRKALQWCRDNATKRKTWEGMPKFIGSWLSRAQNDGRNNGRSIGTGVGSQSLFNREQQREHEQLGTIATWASKRAVSGG